MPAVALLTRRQSRRKKTPLVWPIPYNTLLRLSRLVLLFILLILLIFLILFILLLLLLLSPASRSGSGLKGTLRLVTAGRDR